MHCGYVVKVEKLRPHTNADRLQIATFFGNDTVVDLNTKVGDVGVYFPSDLQLSVEYCEMNNLVRKKDANGNEVGGYLDPDKRNIKAIKLRGEKSDGIFMPIHSLNYCFVNPDVEISIVAGQAEDKLKVGETIDMVNGHEICCKYIPRTTNKRNSGSVSKARKHKEPYAPMFSEHVDTEQLAYNLSAFKVGDELDITLKMHGTSQRTAYLPVLKGHKKTLWEKIRKKVGTPVYEYAYVSGTRRVVMEDFEGGNSFYGSNAFREQHHNAFVGKLMRGETVFYEVVGFTHTGAPIMGNGNNEKVGKDFVKKYGKETVFSYGCTPEGKKMMCGTDDLGAFKVPVETPVSDLYVYRMTLTTDDGFVVEYSPDFVRHRCEQMGVKTVPFLGKALISEDRLHFITPDGKDHDYLIGDGDIGSLVMRLAEDYCDGEDPIGKTHIREGIVIRIVNRPSVKVLKHKNFSFKVLEGIIKDTASAPDMEEAQEVSDTSEDNE